MFEVKAVKETWDSIPDDIKQQIKLWARFSIYGTSAIKLYCNGVKKGAISSKSVIGTTNNLRSDIEDLFRYYIYVAEKKRLEKERDVSIWNVRPSDKLKPIAPKQADTGHYIPSFKSLMDNRMEIPPITISDEMARTVYDEII